MSSFKRVQNHIHKLSGQINELYAIEPVIDIIFCDQDYVDGECHVTYQKKYMKINIFVPSNIKYNINTKTILSVVTLHEYCHYITSINMSGPLRVLSSNFYNWFPTEKTKDEKKTWRQTKKLAEALGIYNKEFYSVMKEYTYTGDIK